MSMPTEHLNKIQKWLDSIVSELKIMGKHGHLDEFEANKSAGAAQYELSKLRESVAKEAET